MTTMKPFDLVFLTKEGNELSSIGHKGIILHLVKNIINSQDETKCCKIYMKNLDLGWNSRVWNSAIKIVQVIFKVEFEPGNVFLKNDDKCILIFVFNFS